MTDITQPPSDNVLSELERERKAIDDAISAYREFQARLANVPALLAQRVVGALKQPAPEPKSQLVSADQPAAEDKPEDRSLVGKTSAECARQILTEHNNEPMHFAEIAKEALAKGYVGQSPEGGLSQTAKEFRAAQSFWAMMHRAESVFEKLQNGYFKLRAEAPSEIPDERENNTRTAFPPGPRSGSSLPTQIAEVLKRQGKAMRGTEIAKALEDSGVQTGSKRGLLGMVLSALRKRTDLFKKVGRGVYKLRDQEDKNPRTGRAGNEPEEASHQQREGHRTEGFFPEAESGQERGSDLAGLSMVAAAVRILGENKDRRMHFREIARIARRRGYSSGRSDSVESLERSFGELLRRESKRPGSLLRRMGSGTFKLRGEGKTETTMSAGIGESL